MIQLIEAPPGSGKTFFAVNYLCKFTSYDALYNEYTLQPNVLIISNIEGLKINHWSLADCLKKKTVEEFFTIENFENIMSKTGKSHIILAIDECHEFFPAGFKNDAIYSFFAFHRHIGLDIVLMTQDLAMTSRMFNPLLEYVIKATPRSRAVLNNFSYSYVSVKGHYLYSKTLTKKPNVFNAYKSQRVDEKNKPKNAVKHWIIITVIIFCGAAFLFKTALAIVKGKGESARIRTEAAKKLKTDPVTLLPGGPAAVAPSVGVLPPPPLPAFHVISSAMPASSEISRNSSSVVGFISRDGFRRYLLSDGRIVASKGSLSVGDIYSF